MLFILLLFLALAIVAVVGGFALMASLGLPESH